MQPRHQLGRIPKSYALGQIDLLCNGLIHSPFQNNDYEADDGL